MDTWLLLNNPHNSVYTVKQGDVLGSCPIGAFRGMKGYSMSLYRNRGFFDSLQSVGTELSAHGIINNFKISEISIPVTNRLDKPRFSSAVKSNFIILRVLQRIHREFS